MSVRIMIGDARAVLRDFPAQSARCCVTSPPYFGLRDYGHAGQIGLEATPDAFVSELVAVFREVRRVLTDDGTLWLNLGDSYSGSGKGDGDTKTTNKGNAATGGITPVGDTAREAAVRRFAGDDRNFGLRSKNLIGIPWRVAFALQADGWYLRSDIIWHKPNPMPESVTDRPTKSHEYLFLLAKSERYYYDAAAIVEERAEPDRVRSDRVGGGSWEGRQQHSEGGVSTGHATRNRRSVWSVNTAPYREAHFATFPPALIEPCILAGSAKGDTILDPFGGAGTTGLVADRLGRSAVLVELNPTYAAMAEKRIHGDSPLFADVSAA